MLFIHYYVIQTESACKEVSIKTNSMLIQQILRDIEPVIIYIVVVIETIETDLIKTQTKLLSPPSEINLESRS